MSAPLSSRYSHESLPPFSLLSLAAGPTETLTGPPVLGKAARILGVELNAGGTPARGARKLQKRRAGPGRLMSTLVCLNVPIQTGRMVDPMENGIIVKTANNFPFLEHLSTPPTSHIIVQRSRESVSSDSSGSRREIERKRALAALEGTFVEDVVGGDGERGGRFIDWSSEEEEESETVEESESEFGEDGDEDLLALFPLSPNGSAGLGSPPSPSIYSDGGASSSAQGSFLDPFDSD